MGRMRARSEVQPEVNAQTYVSPHVTFSYEVLTAD